MAYKSLPNRQEFELNALDTPEGIQGVFCLSSSSWSLAYNLVKFYGYWRSRYYVTEPSGEQRDITDVEYERVTDYVDLTLQELSMSFCSELLTAVTGIADSLTGITQAINVLGGGE